MKKGSNIYQQELKDDFEEVNFSGHREWIFDMLQKLECNQQDKNNCYDVILDFFELLHTEGWKIVKEKKTEALKKERSQSNAR